MSLKFSYKRLYANGTNDSHLEVTIQKFYACSTCKYFYTNLIQISFMPDKYKDIIIQKVHNHGMNLLYFSQNIFVNILAGKKHIESKDSYRRRFISPVMFCSVSLVSMFFLYSSTIFKVDFRKRDK